VEKKQYVAVEDARKDVEGCCIEMCISSPFGKVYFSVLHCRHKTATLNEAYYLATILGTTRFFLEGRKGRRESHGDGWGSCHGMESVEAAAKRKVAKRKVALRLAKREI
jgi:hypothetical protein